MGNRVEILAVNDTAVFRVGAVSRTSGGVYFVPRIRRSDYHLSRHSDGASHWRSKARRQTLFQQSHRSLSDVKFEQLVSMALNPNSFSAYFDEYRRQKADGIFVIDVRRLRADHSSLFVGLLNPRYFRQARGVFSKLEQLYLYTKVEPWLVLGIW